MPSPPSLSPSSSDLPPKRKGKAIRHDVSKPLENTRLSQLINILIAVSVLMTAVYTYRLIQYKNHVGGWGNLALGKFPERPQGVQFQNTPGGGGGGGEIAELDGGVPAALTIVEGLAGEEVTVSWIEDVVIEVMSALFVRDGAAT